MYEKVKLKPLDTTPVQAIFSNTTQIFEIIEFCVRQLGGRCDCFFSTYSTSEEFIRKIFRLKKEGLIGYADIFLDITIANRFKRLLTFMQNTFDNVYVIDNHSKIYLIHSDDKYCTIITSQNQTRGQRYEAGIITTAPDVFWQFFEGLNLLKQNSLNVYDIYRGANRVNSQLCEKPNAD